MSGVVFAGPTIGAGAIRELAPLTVLPPAVQGDVLRAARSGPEVIALIDGRFDSTPAVWHKEILWALSRGIPVWGAASMGALRAAELHPFGMVGVGAVFAAYRDGELEDDDEVAVAHGTVAEDWRAVSEAMVNVRATVDAALAAGVLTGADREVLVEVAKSLHYRRRAWPSIMRSARERGLSSAAVDAFAAWLPEGRVDRKREDAVELLVRIGRGEHMGGPRVTFHFERTELFERLMSRSGIGTGEEPHADAPLADAARLADAWFDAATVALAHAFALERLEHLGIAIGERELLDAGVAIRRRLGLEDPGDLDKWLAANELTLTGFLELATRHAALRCLAIASRDEVDRLLADALRLSGTFPALRERARGMGRPAAEPSTSADATARYARWKDAAGWPQAADDGAIAAQLGFESADELYEAVLAAAESCLAST